MRAESVEYIQYKMYYLYHFHYRQSCYPCHFIFSSELVCIDIV